MSEAPPTDRRHAELAPWIAQIPEVELQLVAISLDSAQSFDAARSLATPSDFADAFLGQAWEELAKLEPSLTPERAEGRSLRLAERLVARGLPLDSISRLALAYAEGVDAAGAETFAPGGALRLATMLRRQRLREQLQHAAIELGKTPNADRLERVSQLGADLSNLELGAKPAPLPLEQLGFTAARLRAIQDREAPVSPLPGLLDPEPHLHVLVARPKTGKTTLALAIARAWAMGVPPWPSAPALPASRVLVVSREQNATALSSSLRRLSLYSDHGNGDTWNEQITIVARDRDLPAPARPLLTLDDAGLAALRSGLELATTSGAPYGLLILDSLSRLKPPDIEEIDNDGMTRWLDALEDLASSLGIYTLLIHHQGHAEGGHRSDARSAGRGASAIAAVAQATWLLERSPDHPHHRILKVDGNSLLPHELTFEVAPDTAEPGSLFRFRLCDPVADAQIDDLLGETEAISTEELAWRLSGTDRVQGERAPRQAARIAASLRERWLKQGLVEIVHGSHGGKLIQRRQPDLPGISDGDDSVSF